MTGIQIATLRRSMGLSPEEFAQLCGVRRQTVQRWEDCLGKPTPPMVEGTRRVLMALLDATRTDRLKITEAMKNPAATRDGPWRAAWALMFGRAPTVSKPAVKLRIS